MSYLTLAHFLSFSGANVLVTPWAGYHANFPPLFPLLLAVSGGSNDLRIAHVIVAACAAGGVALFYRYGARELGEAGGLIAAAFFLLTATAWITLKGVLSEPLLLLMIVASLFYYETRLADRMATPSQWLRFGLLVALACLSHVIGAVLIVAFVVHIWIRHALRRERIVAATFLTLVPPLILLGVWYALRPHAPGDAYAFATSWVIRSWLDAPVQMVPIAAKLFFSGWIRSFVADEAVSKPTRIILGLGGVLMLAGLVQRLRRNRLDAWYVLIALGVVYGWTFSAENVRRLMYPVFPLMIFFAADLVRSVSSRRTWIAAVVALPTLLCLPAVAMIAQKSFDRFPVVEGCPQQYRELSEFYSTLRREDAARLAVLDATVLCGLRSLDKLTPPGSVVMWVRPEYVALLGKRQAVPYLYRWTPSELAYQIRRSKVDYVVVTAINKTDIENGTGQQPVPAGIASEPVLSLTGGVFVLYRVAAN